MESSSSNLTGTTKSSDSKTDCGLGLSTIMDEMNKLLAHNNVFTNFLRKIENATHIQCRIQILALVLVVLLYLAEGYAGALLCNVLSLLLPMCASINAIENPDFESDTKWLMYWVIFCCMNFLEMFISWMPSYNLLKFLFLVWCMAPGKLSGSEVMYFKVVRPFFMKHKSCVNGVISDAAKRVRQVAEKTVHDFMMARACKMAQKTESYVSSPSDVPKDDSGLKKAE